MSKRRLKNRKLLTEINVIPYVDISLVLLVIFMVATPFMIQGIDLDLPKTEAQALNKSKDDNLTISFQKFIPLLNLAKICRESSEHIRFDLLND